MISDSHCHLDYPNLYENLSAVIQRANRNKVNKLLTVCTTLESFDKIKIIIEKYRNIYGTFGIHPHEAKNYTNVDLNFILDIKKNHKKVIGIGETGLDYFYNHSDKNIQKKSFVDHIHAASKLNIPVIVHSRHAENDTFEIIKSEKKNSNFQALIHCFTGSEDFANKLLDLNCYISVSGIITFKNSVDLSKTISKIPLSNLLVETDSPYLAPSPFRGKTNEPSYIIHTIEKLSKIKNISKENIISQTTNNFKKLFNLK